MRFYSLLFVFQSLLPLLAFCSFVMLNWGWILMLWNMLTLFGMPFRENQRIICFYWVCNLLWFKYLQSGKWKTPFCIVKGRLLHVKRACFAMQKGIFYNAKEPLLFSDSDFFLQWRNLFWLSVCAYLVFHRAWVVRWDRVLYV